MCHFDPFGPERSCYYYYYVPDCKPKLGELRRQKPEGPSREDSPVRKEKILERKYNNDKVNNNTKKFDKIKLKVKKEKKKRIFKKLRDIKQTTVHLHPIKMH